MFFKNIKLYKVIYYILNKIKKFFLSFNFTLLLINLNYLN